MLRSFPLLSLLGTVLACADAGAWASDERDAVARTELLSPGLRLATLADNQSPSLSQWLQEHPGYEPYRLLADLNGDGHGDLVLAYWDETSRTFDVRWYPGRTGSGWDAPRKLATAPWLNNGGMMLFYGQFALAEFYSDVIFTFHWDSAAGRMVLDSLDAEGIP